MITFSCSKFWVFLYMTFGAILAKLACNAVKAGMQSRKSHAIKCNGLTKLVRMSVNVNK